MRSFSHAFLLLLLPLTALAEPRPVKTKTPLDSYIAKADATYRYEVAKTLKEATHTSYIVRMRSQTWSKASEVDRVVWEHDLLIVVPHKVQSETGLLFIGGGGNGRPVPNEVDERFAKIAVATGSVVTELKHVPNQPLTFAKDPQKRERVEDEIIAFTWRQFLEGGDVEWLLQLPMAKSAVRAMDTITAVCQKEAEVGVKSFVVAGASKRGWTTWLTAAVDKRVTAMIPIVIDMLNVRPSFQHHYQAYGFFAPAVEDYVEEGIMDWQNTKRYAKLLKVVEPYEYRERYTMPKLVLNGTCDQFFLPDSSQFYYDDLPGEKHLRYVPNAGHGLKNSDAFETILGYYAMILAKQPRPVYEWREEGAETLVVTAKDKPAEVRLWQANNEKTRDFRIDTIGDSAWKSTVLQPNKDGEYVGKVNTPKDGWTAFMIELTYQTAAKVPVKFTTNVRVTPKKLPFPPYEPKHQDD